MKTITFKFEGLDKNIVDEKTLTISEGDKLVFKQTKPARMELIQQYIDLVSQGLDKSDIMFVPEYLDLYILKVGDEK